jgi:hypothetical protein
MKKLYIIMLSGMFLINPAVATIDDVYRATLDLKVDVPESFDELKKAFKK